MKTVLKWRYAMLVFWIVAAAGLAIIQPDVNAILHERGQGKPPADNPSMIAADLLQQIDGDSGTQNLIVFHQEEGLSDTQMQEIEKTVLNIADHAESLGINGIIDPFQTPEARDSLISDNESTLMVSFRLELNGREIAAVKEELEGYLTTITSDYYLSGEDFIINDYLEASISGVDRSALLTVGFILIVLILMFRSLLVPLISLLTVGVTYLVSMGIAAQLIDKLDFPVTSVTQLLLVLILFGIGTDYNILLFNRFKEELANGLSVEEAISVTYKTAGKTIFFSTLTVIIAFAALTFSTFDIYKSANVVAIGTIVLLLQIYSFTPFFMRTLGAKLFWPSRKNIGHKESGMWGRLTGFAVKYPIVVTALVIIAMIPALLFSKQNLSFDQLKELGSEYESARGFELVADNFGRGQALPTNVAIASDTPLDNSEALAVLDQAINALKNLDGVDGVSGVTQPQFEEIDEFYVSNQTGQLTDGLLEARDGLGQIQDGLEQMQAELTTPDFSEAGKLSEGTAQIEDGYRQLTAAVSQLGQGLGNGATGATQLQNGITQSASGAATLSTSLSQLSTAITTIQGQYEALASGYSDVAGGLPQLVEGLKGLNGLINLLGQQHSELANDETYLTLLAQSEALAGGLEQINNGLVELNGNYDLLNAGFKTAAAGLEQASGGLTQLSGGLEQLKTGAGQLSSGFSEAAGGSTTIATNLGTLNDALADVKIGQEELVSGLTQLGDGFAQLRDGLGQSADGVGKVGDGLVEASDFLAQYDTSRTFFLPQEAMEAAEFTQLLDNFLSDDRKLAKMMIVLKDDPYSKDAQHTIEEIESTLDAVFKGTVLESSTIGIGGPSSVTRDMNKLQYDSFASTAIIVIIGVFLVLLLVIRSFLPSIYIILSLIASYYAAMSVANFVAYEIIGADGLSSFVPFFSFIVIVAVGVDYSIFYMMRYQEFSHLDTRTRLVESSKHIGGVIISAMIILGGTFATLIPSGLVLLIEMAAAVITGLVVLCFIMLPLFVPAMMALPESLRNRGK